MVYENTTTPNLWRDGKSKRPASAIRRVVGREVRRRRGREEEMKRGTWRRGRNDFIENSYTLTRVRKRVRTHTTNNNTIAAAPSHPTARSIYPCTPFVYVAAVAAAAAAFVVVVVVVDVGPLSVPQQVTLRGGGYTRALFFTDTAAAGKH